MAATTQATSCRALEDEATLSKSHVARAATELIGSFILFLGIYAICSVGTFFNSTMIGANILTFGAAIGLLYAALTYVFGKVSGAHLNPAVSLASALLGRIGIGDFFVYVIMQCAGAIGAAELLTHLLPVSDASSSYQITLFQWIHNAINGADAASPATYSLNQIGAAGLNFGIKIGALVEVAMTIVVVAVALRAQNDNGVPRRTAWLATGIAYAAGTAVAFPFTGAALNPARATGMAVAGQSAVQAYNDTLPTTASSTSSSASQVTIPLPLTQLWVFWVAPLLAAAVVALVMLVARMLRADDESQKAATAKVSTKAAAQAPLNSSTIAASDDATDSAAHAETLSEAGVSYSVDDETDDDDSADSADSKTDDAEDSAK